MEKMKLNLLIVLSLLLAAILISLWKHASIFFLPVFFVVPSFWSPRKKVERKESDEEEDPADWWKKGKRQDA